MCTGCRFWWRGHCVEVWPCELDVHKGVGKIGLGGEKCQNFVNVCGPLSSGSDFFWMVGVWGRAPGGVQGQSPWSGGQRAIAPWTHTHTHLFNGPFSGTTQVIQYQKGKTNLDFIEARDSGSGISWAICKSAPCSRQITMPVPHHSVFYRPDALPTAQPTASKHWRH